MARRTFQIGRFVRAAALGLCLGVAMLWARPTLAENVDEVFAQATEAFANGKFDLAYRLHTKAWALRKSYKTAAGLGQVELHLGKYRDAAEHLDYCLRHYPADADADVRRQIQSGYDEALKQVAAIRISVEPPEARVRVDKQDLGPGPFPLIFVRPGKMEIEASHEGYETEAQTIRTTAGSTRDVSFALVTIGSSSPATDAGSELATDGGADTGSTGGMEPRTAALIVGGGLTAVALGVGIGFSLKGSGHEGDRTDLLVAAESDFGPSPCAGSGSSRAVCAEIRDAADDRNGARGIANVAFVATGVLAAATLGAFLLWPSSGDASSTALHVAPVIGPGRAEVGLGGSF